MSQRKFKFPGTDAEYIEYLERELIRTKSLLNDDGPATSRIRFIECTPELTRNQRRPHEREIPKWKKQLKKQLHTFVEGALAATQWELARRNAGIDTPTRNRTALKLILGHGGAAIFPKEYGITVLPPISPTEPRELVVRGCQYGNFIVHCDKDQVFAARVAAFQKLVFCSYCVVMLRAGVSKKATNDMMRQYTGEKKDDLTLEKDRHGAVWANRCMSALLENGWGHGSWEIFLLESRSPAQFGRFAAHNADSYRMVVNQLGLAEIPPWEFGWIPYCLPCIVHHLTGYKVPLVDICEALGYGTLPVSTVQLISAPFTEALHCVLGDNEVQNAIPIEQHHTESYILPGFLDNQP